ncbi:MAG: hypothetical protein HKP01_08855 [Gemmatimonadetes bacterium]|nr:hypothetical protein [Gemmatimonadota bacterium]
MRWRILLVPLMAGFAAAGCDGQSTAPQPEDAIDGLSVKVEKVESRFTVSNVGTETYVECLGEVLLWYGTFDVIWTEKTTPSGNWIASWKLDYFGTDEVTWLKGEDSDVIWNLDKAENQGTGWIMKGSGPQSIQHYESNEWYENDEGDRLHIRLQGRFMYDADGAPKMERDVAWGHCQ